LSAPLPLLVTQVGDEIEISRGNKKQKIPLSALEGIAREIGNATDATVMAWHCISAVEEVFSLIEIHSLRAFLLEPHTHNEATRGTTPHK
jgi:hypothetical protein